MITTFWELWLLGESFAADPNQIPTQIRHESLFSGYEHVINPLSWA